MTLRSTATGPMNTAGQTTSASTRPARISLASAPRLLQDARTAAAAAGASFVLRPSGSGDVADPLADLDAYAARERPGIALRRGGVRRAANKAQLAAIAVGAGQFPISWKNVGVSITRCRDEERDTVLAIVNAAAELVFFKPDVAVALTRGKIALSWVGLTGSYLTAS